MIEPTTPVISETVPEVVPATTYVKYNSIKTSPQEIRDFIAKLYDDGYGAPYIRKQLQSQFNYNPAITAVSKYIAKLKLLKANPSLPARAALDKHKLLNGSKKANDTLEAVRVEISTVNDLLAKLPTTSEKVTILKSIICKCVDRVMEIETQPFIPQTEAILVRYLGEIRENVALLTKLSEQELSTERIDEAVQAEFANLLETVKDVIAEVCPEKLSIIGEKLKTRLQSLSSDARPTPKDP